MVIHCQPSKFSTFPYPQNPMISMFDSCMCNSKYCVVVIELCYGGWIIRGDYLESESCMVWIMMIELVCLWKIVCSWWKVCIWGMKYWNCVKLVFGCGLLKCGVKIKLFVKCVRVCGSDYVMIGDVSMCCMI